MCGMKDHQGPGWSFGFGVGGDMVIIFLEMFCRGCWKDGKVR
jgi:hypothetical protein